MRLEHIILISSWFIMILLLWKFVPRNKIREASVIFLFKQMMTWLLGLIIVNFNWIEYPVRFFSNATKSSFTFEYFVFPAICVLFNLHFPDNKGWLKKFNHYFIYIFIMTSIEVTLEKYTMIIEYNEWKWYWSAIGLFVTFYISRKYYLWFFNREVGLKNNTKKL